MEKKECSSAGNVLFIILIAIVLFAALNYSVSSLARGNASEPIKEKARVQGASVIDFSNDLKAGILRLRTTKGLAITDLKFNNDVYKVGSGSLSYGALGTPADPSLYVFHPKGGAVSPQTFSTISNTCPSCSSTQVLPGHISLQWINIPENGTSTSDPSLLIYGLKDDACLAINRNIGISFIPLLTLGKSNLVGSTGPVAVAAVSGATASINAIKGKGTFCGRETATTARNFFIDTFQVN